MWAIRSLMALRKSCRRRCGALCMSWSISNDSSRELRACSHCHSSLKPIHMEIPHSRECNKGAQFHVQVWFSLFCLFRQVSDWNSRIFKMQRNIFSPQIQKQIFSSHCTIRPSQVHWATLLTLFPTWTRCCCPEFLCDRGHWGVSEAPAL